MKAWCLFLIAALALGQQGTKRRVGIIDFFGYKGVDLAALRAALPLHVGDPFDAQHFDTDLFKDVTAQAAGQKLTDFNITCCDPDGNYLLYIGLRGGSYRQVEFHAAPTGSGRLSAALKRASDAAGKAVGQAVLSGHAEEDDSQGFALLNDPKARAKQLDFRKVVLREQESIAAVLATSSDAQERADAADALGYAERSDAQIAALVNACLDPDSAVRNNAVRALAVLAEGFPESSARIPAHPFICFSPREPGATATSRRC